MSCNLIGISYDTIALLFFNSWPHMKLVCVYKLYSHCVVALSASSSSLLFYLPLFLIFSSLSRSFALNVRMIAHILFAANILFVVDILFEVYLHISVTFLYIKREVHFLLSLGSILPNDLLRICYYVFVMIIWITLVDMRSPFTKIYAIMYIFF